MRAVDTNLVTRYVIRDDLHQADAAGAVLATPCYLSATVLLETAWVLSSRYRIDRVTLAAVLSDLLALPALTPADREGFAWAIKRFARGADLADMLHLTASRRTDAFVTFDRRLARAAGPDAPVPIETLA